MNTILEPILKDTITRYSKWKNPSPADAARILGPALEAVCLSAKVPAARATEWLQSQGVETITPESIHAFVRAVTEIPVADLAIMRAKTAALVASVSRTEPLTERDTVLLERSKPLAERSRDSILAELFEVRSGYIRGAVDGRYALKGEALPEFVWSRLVADGREGVLQGELDQRDCRINGVEYKPSARTNARSDMSSLMPMRG